MDSTSGFPMDQCFHVGLSAQCHDIHCDEYARPSCRDRRIWIGESRISALRSGNLHWNLSRIRSEEAMAGACARKYLRCHWDGAIVTTPTLIGRLPFGE